MKKKEGKDHRTNRQHLSMKIVYFTITFYFLGLLVGYAEMMPENFPVWVQDFVKAHPDWWDNYYYLWDKLKDLFLFVCIFNLVPHKNIKPALLLICGFCGVRIIWEFIAITDYQLANSDKIMLSMFVGWWVAIIILIAMGIKEQWQQQ